MSEPDKSQKIPAAPESTPPVDSYADELSRLEAENAASEDILEETPIDEILAQTAASSAPLEKVDSTATDGDGTVAANKPIHGSGDPSDTPNPVTRSQETGHPNDQQTSASPGMEAPSPPDEAYVNGDPARDSVDAIHNFTEICRKETTPAGKLYVMINTLRHTIDRQDWDNSLKTQNALKEYLATFPGSSPSLGISPDAHQSMSIAVDALEEMLRHEDFESGKTISEHLTPPTLALLKPDASVKNGDFHKKFGQHLKVYPEKFAATAQQITQDRKSHLQNLDGRKAALSKAEEKAAKEAQKNPSLQGGGGFSINMDLGLGKTKNAAKVSASALHNYLQRKKQSNLAEKLAQNHSPLAKGIDADIQTCKALIRDTNDVVKGIREHKQTKRHFEELDRAMYDPVSSPEYIRKLRHDIQRVIDDEQKKPHSHFVRQQKKIGSNAERISECLDSINDKLAESPALAKEKRQDIQKMKGLMDNMMHKVTGGDDGIDKSHPDDRGKLGKLMDKMQALMDRISHIVEKLAKTVMSRLSAG